jgi:hypothetical protein
MRTKAWLVGGLKHSTKLDSRLSIDAQASTGGVR